MQRITCVIRHRNIHRPQLRHDIHSVFQETPLVLRLAFSDGSVYPRQATERTDIAVVLLALVSDVTG